MASLLEIEAPTFREAFARRSIAVNHHLVDHPLFSLDAIAELAEVGRQALSEDGGLEGLLEEMVPERIGVLEAESVAEAAHAVARSRTACGAG